MKFKTMIGLLLVLALSLTLFAACSEEGGVDVNGEDENPTSTPSAEPETIPEEESESESESESAPEVIVESDPESETESEPESESESESESEEAETQEEVETDFAEEVYYGVRIDGFDINRGKIDLTVCTVKSGIDVNKLTDDDFTPTGETKSLILPGNTKVMQVEGGKISASDMEEICTGIFAVLEGDDNYMELYLYID